MHSLLICVMVALHFKTTCHWREDNQMGGDFGYEWDRDQYVHYSTRHMDKTILRRLKVLATQMDESVEYVLNRALDLGITRLEKVRR